MITLEQLLSRTVECGDCLEWTGYVVNGSPQVSIDGRYHSCRRIVVQLSGGTIRKDVRPVMKCRNPKCLNRNHIVLLTHKQIGSLAAKEGKFSSPERCIAVSRGRRRSKTCKLDLAAAADIRSLPTAIEGARKYGINKSLAARIRRGEAWRTSAANSSIFSMWK